ncbi:MAG: GNAT family N-acetyltransferase [Bacteroidetes bacterium]|nr:GNAT family N-acetyltransferase [Bacteroidota bacterium]
MNYNFRSGYENMDFDKVSGMLTNAYWCKGICKPEVMKGAGNSSLVVGVFSPENEQIGYARVISDKTRFAYILDVIIDDRFRRQGIGQHLMMYILQHEDLKEVYQFLLRTSDAHGVYSKVGFQPVSRPADWMEIRHSRPERKGHGKNS